MFPLTRSFMKRILFDGTVSALMVIALTLLPILTSADEDPCHEKGIYIGNQTMLNLWYTLNGGPCTIWSDDRILIIKAEDTIIIYRDMTCETKYCANNPTYDVYKSLDADRNCRVRILPNCTLSDM